MANRTKAHRVLRALWILLFVGFPAAMLALCLVAPQYGWAFPGSGVSEHPLGREIDHLFYVILWITGAVFVITHLVLGYVLWSGSVRRGKALYVHHNNWLELIWTVVPAGLLLFISLYQMNVWADFRMESQFPQAARESVVAEVTGRQFEWRIRFPEPGTRLTAEPHVRDAYDVNELHVPAGKPVMVWLRTADVQHSLYFPSLRVKQDAVAGLTIPVWFQVDEPGEYPIVCTELCGWGHYKMGAKLVAHAPEEWDSFAAAYYAERFSDGVSSPEEAAAEAASVAEQGSNLAAGE